MSSDGDPADPSTGDRDRDVPLEVIPLHSTNLLTVLDPSGVVQYESPAIERIFGFTQAELVGEPVAAYFHPDDRGDVLEAFQSVVDGAVETVEAVEFRHRCADGEYTWVESVASGNPTPGGNYVVNTRDVSERKRRERELVRTNERLDRFARVLTHDLRNPLQVARARVELAGEDGGDEGGDNLDAACAALDRMATLIDDSLQFARDGPAAERSPCSIAGVARAAWRVVPTGDASLEPTTAQAILAERSRLQRAFENLFRNAVEHTAARGEAGDGTGRSVPSSVTVRVVPRPDGFAVEDDGPGIPVGERERVLEPGYAGVDGGLGEGLGIVADVARDHGWDLAVTETEAGGARFEFTGVRTPESQ